ncbi:MFS transporter [Ponticaulis sp.]|uniref:spinster family MFS transporter n=1 Tax=Ponticaulis sp. TaxID=2020902 RepID=UPI000B67B307|nr:MFS transporter [Ponticaulis sp.]MAI91675.1 MFS transporter [Ponticaulis sp.]OUX96939.1 MAG: MFS transporter [Hyphomonadaceae bacterium TMED5]|tara:strand:- start:1482 stop:2987 length:1506 start_codon:yes stop_codon:yes gene_type:complete
MSDTPVSQGNGHILGFGSKSYRTYVLVALTLIYTLNFIDRTLITVVAQPIMNELGLSDSQFGFLTGPPFAIFYALMGIPIALVADRSNRVIVISICIVIWSLMTVFCGFAAGFLWLILFRIGVAIGEAGGTPPANSILTDYFPIKSRANAIGIYSMGVTLGAVLAQVFGGSIAGISGPDFGNWLSSIGLGGLFSSIDWTTVSGWRIAFVIVGAPGILIGILLWLTVKEPPRGYTELPGSHTQEKAGFTDGFKEFAKSRTFWWGALGASFTSLVGYGLQSFQAPFLQRVYDIGVREAALYYGAPLALAAAAGTFLGGFTSEKLEAKYHSVVAWLPSIGLTLAVPFYLAAFFAPSISIAFPFWVAGAICHYSYLGAQYSIATAIVSPKARATSVAVLLFMVSLIGNGIGPLFVGMMSDFFMATKISAAGLTEFARTFDPRTCSGAVFEAGTNELAYCTAYAEGLRLSMGATALWFLLAAFCFFMAGKTFNKDRWSKSEPPIGV